MWRGGVTLSSGFRQKFKNLLGQYQCNLGWTDFFAIPIFYIGGDRFNNRSIGCGGPFPLPGTGIIAPCVVLPNGAKGFLRTTPTGIIGNSPYVLATELGHVLLYDPRTGDFNNPSPTASATDPIHDLDPRNIMAPAVDILLPEVNPQQCAKARLSRFTSRFDTIVFNHEPAYKDRVRAEISRTENEIASIEDKIIFFQDELDGLKGGFEGESPQEKAGHGQRMANLRASISYLISRKHSLEAEKSRFQSCLQ